MFLTVVVKLFVVRLINQKVNATWVVQIYSQRNWVEMFYREAKGWFGLSESQIRDAKAIKRH